MSDGLDINILTGRAKDIAVNVDSNNVKDGKLSDKEISIFLEECEKNGVEVTKEPWYSKCSTILSKYINNVAERINGFTPNSQEYVAVRDATYVAPPADVEIKKQQIAHDTDIQRKEMKAPLKLSEASNIRTDYDWSAEEFSKVIDQMLNSPRYRGKFKDSVLQGKAQAFIEAAKKYNVDPRILVAIAMCESSRGTSDKAQKLNNIGGLRIGGKYHHFESVEASIDSIAKTMNTRYTEGFTTPKKIAYSGRYCAKQAASSWLSQVNSYLGFFDKYYKNEN